MISSLHVIENPIQLDKLHKFVPDNSIKQHLAYMNIPMVDNTSGDDDSDDQFIDQNDKILISTPNNEDISMLSFHVYNQSSMFIHHDLYVFSTIISSAVIDSSPYPFVALATFEPDILIYDISIKFPILPQIVLVGHSGPVTALKMYGDALWSASDDGSVIKWDANLTAGTIINKNDKIIKTGVGINKMDINDNNIVYTAGRYININKTSINLEYEIEQIKILNNLIYIGDETGRVIIYDIRNLQNECYSKKIHGNAIYSMEFNSKQVVTSSADGLVKVFDLDGFREVGSYERNAPVSAMCFDSDGKLFCGDENDGISTLLI